MSDDSQRFVKAATQLIFARLEIALIESTAGTPEELLADVLKELDRTEDVLLSEFDFSNG